MTQASTQLKPQSSLVEPSGIEPESCNRPFVGFGAVEHQSRPQKWHLCNCQGCKGFFNFAFVVLFILILHL